MYFKITFYVIDILLNKCGSHIKNKAHPTLILYGYINATLVHICAKTQEIYMYVLLLSFCAITNMPHKLHTYAIHWRE